MFLKLWIKQAVSAGQIFNVFLPLKLFEVGEVFAKKTTKKQSLSVQQKLGLNIVPNT